MATRPTDDGQGFRILLVEDDVALGAALRFALEIEGYAVELMDAAEPLLDRTFPTGRTCLVTDQNLPGLSGVEAVEILRTRGVAAPAILMTTQVSPALRARAAKAGAAVVEKPILGRRLIDAIRALRTD